MYANECVLWSISLRHKAYSESSGRTPSSVLYMHTYTHTYIYMNACIHIIPQKKEIAIAGLSWLLRDLSHTHVYAHKKDVNTYTNYLKRRRSQG